MTDGVAIAGHSEQVRTANASHSLEEMITAAARGALASAGIDLADVGGVVISASDQIDGRAISSMLTGGPAGAFLKDEINIASSPGHAFVMACLTILSGQQSRVLLTSWGKTTEVAVEGGTAAVERLSADPVYERDVGIEPVAALGFQAGLYRSRVARGEEAAHAVVIRNRSNAARNDRAFVREQIDPGEILDSTPLAYPLRSLELPRAGDGAYSLVLTATGQAAHDAPVVTGFGWCTDSARLAERDLVTMPHLRSAASDAYARAGVREPSRELDLWELSAGSGDAEILTYRALGLCDDGNATAFALSGGGDLEGELPVNPSGGPWAGDIPFGGGLRPIVES